MSRKQTGQTNSRGQGLVEFALVLPLLVLLFMGVFDFARGIYAYNAISDAARAGTRTAIVNQNNQDIVNRASAQAIGLGITTVPAGSCPPTGSNGICVRYLTSDLSSACSPASIGCVAEVAVKYTFTPSTPIISSIIPSLVLGSTSQEPIESTCTGTCPIP
jgi:Flp pilus assembly protein TadG